MCAAAFRSRLRGDPETGVWTTCQEVCPRNVSFTAERREDAFAARAMFLDAGSRDGTRALAREIFMMDAADYAASSKGSAIKRAKLWMLKRNACVVPGNVGTHEDLAVLEAMLVHEHEVVRERHQAVSIGADRHAGHTAATTDDSS